MLHWVLLGLVCLVCECVVVWLCESAQSLLQLLGSNQAAHAHAQGRVLTILMAVSSQRCGSTMWVHDDARDATHKRGSRAMV